jgi:hypothetical protein
MELSASGEANISAFTQEIPLILRNSKINYDHFHKSSPLVPLLSQLSPVNAPIPHLEKFILIL